MYMYMQLLILHRFYEIVVRITVPLLHVLQTNVQRLHSNLQGHYMPMQIHVFLSTTFQDCLACPAKEMRKHFFLPVFSEYYLLPSSLLHHSTLQ